MKERLPAHAVVGLAALDLRREPRHPSELTSQLLGGEVVAVRGASRDGRWWRVENRNDGYRGWARTWGLVGASSARIRRWDARATAVVRAPVAWLRARPGAGASVGPLFHGGRAIPRGRSGGFRKLELADGRLGWTRASELVGATARPRPLLERIQSLMGIPYLWGGRTPLGLDCSALVQLLFAEQRAWLPRDAARQLAVSTRVSRRDVVPGDLYFFGRPKERVGHVGVALGGGLYAHARGHVRLASFDPANPLYDKELAAQFRAAARPPVGRSRRPPRRHRA